MQTKLVICANYFEFLEYRPPGLLSSMVFLNFDDDTESSCIGDASLFLFLSLCFTMNIDIEH